MKLRLFLLLPILLFVLAACDREESLLLTEVELPREPTLVEEEELFLRHRLASITAIDTTGTAIYAEEFGWFWLANTRHDYYECSVSEGQFSVSGQGGNVEGGNEEDVSFFIFGRTLDPTQAFSGSITYLTTNDAGQPIFYFSGHCRAPVSITFTEVTEERIQGFFTGELAGFAGQGTLPECDDPRLEFRTISAEFNLRRQYCE